MNYDILRRKVYLKKKSVEIIFFERFFSSLGFSEYRVKIKKKKTTKICTMKYRNLVSDDIESSKESSPPPPFHLSGTSPTTNISTTQSGSLAVFTPLHPILSPTKRPTRLMSDMRNNVDDNPLHQISA